MRRTVAGGCVRHKLHFSRVPTTKHAVGCAARVFFVSVCVCFRLLFYYYLLHLPGNLMSRSNCGRRDIFRPPGVCLIMGFSSPCQMMGAGRRKKQNSLQRGSVAVAKGRQKVETPFYRACGMGKEVRRSLESRQNGEKGKISPSFSPRVSGRHAHAFCVVSGRKKDKAAIFTTSFHVRGRESGRLFA